MNKKGFFYSLSAALLLIIMSLVLHLNAESAASKRDTTLEEIRFGVASSYTEDFENYYLKDILSISSKYAFKAIADHVGVNGPVADLKVSVQDLVITGNSAGGMMMPQNITAPFIISTSQSLLPVNVTTNSLSITVSGITQPDPWHITIQYSVGFEFEMLNLIWSDVITEDVTITIYGLEDPVFHQRVNQAYWQEDPTIDCFLRKLGYACAVEGVCPIASP